MEIAPGAIAYYEKVRPIIDAACDAAGLGTDTAMYVDDMLFYRICKRGPGAATLESFLDTLELQRLGHIPASLEATLARASYDEDGNEEYIPLYPVESIAAASDYDGVEAWGPAPERALAEPLNPSVPIMGYGSRHVASHYINERRCMVCNKTAKTMYAHKQGKGDRELCSRCLSTIDDERLLDGMKPLKVRTMA